jgi:AcrR family transcriptional regulator
MSSFKQLFETDVCRRTLRPVEADTRTRILDAAEQLFVSHGLDATTLRMITAAAQANLAAVNYHFGSKEALIEAVFRRRLTWLNEQRIAALTAFEAEAKGGPLKPRQIVEAFFGVAIRRAHAAGPCRRPSARRSKPPARSGGRRAVLRQARLEQAARLPAAEADAEEQSFLDNESRNAVRLTDDWETHLVYDLPPEAWQYIKDKGFLGMIIPKQYGGLGSPPGALAGGDQAVDALRRVGGVGDGAQLARARPNCCCTTAPRRRRTTTCRAWPRAWRSPASR